MPGRYEIVDEPVETLEVVDDEVYHPDLTVRDTPTASFRSLEPIISGPITLKTIFYDPRWSTNKRRCCVCFVAVTSLVCFCLMISLFVGLGQVLSYINESERLRQTGLYMVPDLEQYDIGVFLYNSDKKFSQFHKRYIGEIDAFLEKYAEDSKNYPICKENERPQIGKPCRFDLAWLGTSCTKKNSYGYKDGNPCILFALRNVKTWTPNITESYLKSGDSTLIKNPKKRRQFDRNHLPLNCSASAATRGNLPDNYTFNYYPEGGFNLTFLDGASDSQIQAPLVFVQFVQPPYQSYPAINVKCQIFAPNLDEFKGVKLMNFEFDDPDAVEGTAFDRP